MSKRVFTFVIILTGLLFLDNCGNGGGPGAPGSSTGLIGASVDVTAIIHSTVNKTAGDVWEIDVQNGFCADGKTAESFGDEYAVMTVAATSYDATNPSGTLYITRYTVEYHAQNLELNLPPIATYDNTTQVAILHDSSSPVTALIFKGGDKVAYWNALLNGKYNPAVNMPYLYDMKITLYGVDAYGTTFSVVVHRTVQLADYATC
ncbi:MAG: hypothetical protein HQK89_05270 [Nitrospirae bacterium]|nr:hypothetical protein [Nitrospirota bacterium]